MTALDRYLAREILLPFAASVLFLTQVLLATQILAQADVLLGAGVSFRDLVSVIGDLIPHFLGYVLPVSFLLGAVLGLGRLTEDREMVALGAAGVSPLRLVPVPLVLGLAASVLALWVGLVLEPAGLRDARLRLNDLIRRNVSRDVQAGVFFEDIPNFTLYAESTAGGRWSHVLLSDRTDPTAPLLALAQGGHLEPTGAGEGMELELDQGEIHREELQSDEYFSGHFSAATITLGLGAALSDRNRLIGSPFELGPREIVARARAAKEPETARRWWTFLHRRIAGPVAIVAFALLAVPLGMAHRGGRAFGYTATLLAVIAYYALLRLGEGLSSRGTLAAWMGPHLPNVATALLGVALVALVELRGLGTRR